MRCGHCKTEGVDLTHVRACSQGTTITAVVPDFTTSYVEKRDFKPMALTLPASKYALERAEGPVFYEIQYGKKGRWDGFLFLNRLVGHPGDWKRVAVKGAAKDHILEEIGQDHKAAIVAFGHLFTVCAMCSSPLSDADSIARGVGPICEAKI
jgi:hypothetical protein